MMMHLVRQCLPQDYHNAQILVLAYLIQRHNHDFFRDLGFVSGYTNFRSFLGRLWRVAVALLLFKLFWVAYLGLQIDHRRMKHAWILV